MVYQEKRKATAHEKSGDPETTDSGDDVEAGVDDAGEQGQQGHTTGATRKPPPARQNMAEGGLKSRPIANAVATSTSFSTFTARGTRRR